MAEIAWTSEAIRWLEDIFEYIAADNPDAATRTVENIFERAQVLAQYPEMGHRYLHSTRNVRIILIAVSIVHTETPSRIHLISFRKATRNEETILFKSLQD